MLQATLRPKAAIVSKKINNFHFFPYKSLCDQIWLWRKMGQGQPRVIIWTTLVVLPYTMVHTKFQGHWSIGSGEDFLRFLPYIGMAVILVMWPMPFEQLFFPKGPEGCIWNLVAIGPVGSEEKSFEIVDGRSLHNSAYTISSPGAFGSGELKKCCNKAVVPKEHTGYPETTNATDNNAAEINRRK